MIRLSWLTKVLLGIIIALLCVISVLEKERKKLLFYSAPLGSDSEEYILNESNDLIHQLNANHVFPGKIQFVGRSISIYWGTELSN